MKNKNEEKAREIANNCSTVIVGAEVSDETYITTVPDCYTAALAMAKWKDEEFAKEKEALINKACEWLSIHDNYSTPTHVLVEQFQQAMKGGNNE